MPILISCDEVVGPENIQDEKFVLVFLTEVTPALSDLTVLNMHHPYLFPAADSNLQICSLILRSES